MAFRNWFQRTKKTNYNPFSWLRDITYREGEVDMATAFANTVFICTDMRSSTFASIPNTVVRLDSEGGKEEVGTDHWLPQIFAKPHARFTWYQVKKMLQLWLDYTGNAYLYVNQENQLLVLPSSWITIKISDKPGQLIDSYVMKMEGTETKFMPEEICHFKTMYPSKVRGNNFWSGSPGLLNAAAHSIKADDAMIKFVQGYFENEAVPPFILLAEKGFTKEEGERFKKQWGQAMSRYPIKGILESGKDVKPLITGTGQAANNISGSYDELTQRMIVGVYGIPYSKFTSNYDNRNAAETVEGVFRQQTIEPIVNYFEEQLTSFFVSKEENILITHKPYEYRDAEMELKKRNEDLTHGRQSLNDQRKEDGIEGVEGGDTIWVPTNVTTLEKLNAVVGMDTDSTVNTDVNNDDGGNADNDSGDGEGATQETPKNEKPDKAVKKKLIEIGSGYGSIS